MNIRQKFKRAKRALACVTVTSVTACLLATNAAGAMSSDRTGLLADAKRISGDKIIITIDSSKFQKNVTAAEKTFAHMWDKYKRFSAVAKSVNPALNQDFIDAALDSGLSKKEATTMLQGLPKTVDANILYFLAGRNYCIYNLPDQPAALLVFPHPDKPFEPTEKDWELLGNSTGLPHVVEDKNLGFAQRFLKVGWVHEHAHLGDPFVDKISKKFQQGREITLADKRASESYADSLTTSILLDHGEVLAAKDLQARSHLHMVSADKFDHGTAYVIANTMAAHDVDGYQPNTMTYERLDKAWDGIDRVLEKVGKTTETPLTLKRGNRNVSITDVVAVLDASVKNGAITDPDQKRVAQDTVKAYLWLEKSSKLTGAELKAEEARHAALVPTRSAEGSELTASLDI